MEELGEKSADAGSGDVAGYLSVRERRKGQVHEVPADEANILCFCHFIVWRVTFKNDGSIPLSVKLVPHLK